MNKSTLELTIAIEADKATLRQIHKRLTAIATDRIALADLLTDWINERLILAGVSGDFEVRFRPDHMRVHEGGKHGLNAQEWLEREILSNHLTDHQDNLSDVSQDYPLYSD